MSEMGMVSPFAKHQGVLSIGNQEIECYVLDTGDRVLSTRAAARALEGGESASSNLGHLVNAKAIAPHLAQNDVQFMETLIDFLIPGIPGMARGITAERFLDICKAYADALTGGVVLTQKQNKIAMQSIILLSACSNVGLIALIDEATGYQYERAEDALQVKLRAFISEELRDWDKTFPDELWEEFGRLTNWAAIHQRPKYWGKLVLELIYDALDPDVTAYLRENKPKPEHGRNYHQWLTEDVGLKALVPHIYQIVGIAKTCDTMHELRQKVAHFYKKEPMQLSMGSFIDHI